MRYWIATALLATAAAPAYAESWRIAGVANDYPALLVFMDADSVRRVGNTATFELRMFEEGDTADQDKQINERWRVDCNSTHYISEYSVTYVADKITEEFYTDADARLPVENGVDLSVVQTACGTKDYQSETKANPKAYANEYFEDLAMGETG